MTWIRSYLAAPLIYGDQVIGIINLGSNQANAFRTDMAKNLRAFAASAAIAIQNARLYQTEQQNRKIAEILSKASVALSESLDIQHVMETILDYVQLVLPLNVAFIVLTEGDDRYAIRGVRTNDEQYLARAFLNQSFDLLSESVIKPFFETQTSTSIPDAQQLDEWTLSPELASMRSWLGIPLLSTGKLMGMVVAANVEPNSFSADQIKLAEAVVGHATVALQNAWLFEQVRSGRQRLQLLSRHLVEIQENERKYIARELHDETSQALTSLKLGLHAIEQVAENQGNIVDQVANLKKLTDEILESLHRLAINLRPASLDHLGLVDALTSLVQNTGQRAGIPARFKSLGVDQRGRLTEEIEASLYRIVQESLTNIVRHAHAAHADVILEWKADKIVIIVEDDGVGIDLQSARSSGQLGLVGMQERAEMLGGSLLIDSVPQTGTTLVVEIPYVQ
jgi:signal transduction histidine kinase